MISFDPISHARTFAATAHMGQKYGDLPYLVHLEDVVNNLIDIYNGEDVHYTTDSTWHDVLSVGYLHDVLEDTNIPYNVLERLFGSRVAQYVELLTKRGTRREAYEKALGHPVSRIAKLADRLANVQSGAKNDMYLKDWHRDFEPVFGAFLREMGTPEEHILFNRIRNILLKE